jgi:hypothetical protein
MAEISPRKRASMPAKEFGLPEKARTTEAKKATGNYPMPDVKHAANAKSRSTQQYKVGNLSKNEKERIHRKANAVLDDDK